MIDALHLSRGESRLTRATVRASVRALSLISITVFCTACAGGQKTSSEKPPPKKAKRPPRRPGSPPGQAELEAAVNAAKQEDLDAAIEHSKQAIAQNPQLEHAYLLYGSSCAMKGDADCEMGAYEQGLAALPRSLALKKAMGLALLAKDQAKAVETLEEANRLAQGKDPELLADLAYAYIFVERLDEGEALARKAIEIDSKCFQCNMALGEILLVSKKFDGAAEAYGRAAELLPEEPEAKKKLAKSTYLAGKKKQAFEMYAAQLEKNPDDPAFRFEYAKVLLDGGKPKKAVEQLEKLLESNPDEPNLLKMLYRAQKKAGNRKGARKTKKRLKALGVKP